MSDATPKELLDELANDLTARGLAEHGDFYITGRHPDKIPSSELIGMRYREDTGTYDVWYRDMGMQRDLIETPDYRKARAVFVREAVALAKGRGRRVRDNDTA